MDGKPLLIFPEPAEVKKSNPGGGGGDYHFPAHKRQLARLTLQFRELSQAFENKRAELQLGTTGIIPEQVLVFETIGGVEDFINAVKRIKGMEWLGEIEEEDLPPDDDFYIEKKKEKSLSGRIYLIMINQRAMEELLSLWNRFEKDENIKFEFGLAKFLHLFKQLKKIRLWDAQDRLEGTGVLGDWQERISFNEEIIKFETELWFRSGATEKSYSEFKRLIESENGQILSQAIIPEIAYHGILAELPIASIQNIINNRNIQVVKCDQVMFFRPTGQNSVVIPDSAPESDDPSLPEHPLSIKGEPIIALLDGLPLENHRLLSGRLSVDDPEDWAEAYQANERYHGTAMASLILYDELDKNAAPLERPIYVRPILKPDPRDFRSPRMESSPDDILFVDLIHRAVKRIKEGENGEPPSAPGVCIVNLSIGDRARLFDYTMSPLARLIDWLAEKYNILFIISAGNHAQEFAFDMQRNAFRTLDAAERQAYVIKAISNDVRNRRLLAPAEAINSLSVASLHKDHSTPLSPPHLFDLITDDGLPSPVNALGFGYRRAIKPEILIPGGRQMFSEKYDGDGAHTVLVSQLHSISPGQKAASPGSIEGITGATTYCRGTSNAAALTTRMAAKLYEMIDDLRQNNPNGLLQDKYIPVLIKTLIVHSASWGNAYSKLYRILNETVNNQNFDEYVSRFLGYGAANPERVYSCTDQRATLLGCGELDDGRAHVYSLPLPPSLSGRRDKRRLITTLSWFTPICSTLRKYRCAALWFEAPQDELSVNRLEADWRAVRRGTVQHEILEGERAVAFLDGDFIRLKVNCRKDAKALDAPVKYAIAATLEVAEEFEIPIYEEIRDRIRPMVPVPVK